MTTPTTRDSAIAQAIADALEPFARAYCFVDDRIRGEAAFDIKGLMNAVTIGDFRRADEALASLRRSASASGETGAKAKLVPYSSVVGQSIMLLGYNGAVIAQLAILNVQPASLSGDDRKKTTIAIAEWIVEALNARTPSGETREETES